MAGGDGFVAIPWYATGFRGDALEAALGEIAAIAMRYGATEFSVYRSRDDRYRFVQYVAFTDGADFERYWYGPEFSAWRADHSSWYQVPVVYGWTDRTAVGSLVAAAAAASEPGGA